MQNGWFVGRAGLEAQVGLQIGVILQVRAPTPKQKRSPLNYKGQTSYSSPISKMPMRFILLYFFLFYHLVYKSWVDHPACKPTDLNLLWGWSTLHFVRWVVMLLRWMNKAQANRGFYIHTLLDGGIDGWKVRLLCMRRFNSTPAHNKPLVCICRPRTFPMLVMCRHVTVSF